MLPLASIARFDSIAGFAALRLLRRTALGLALLLLAPPALAQVLTPLSQLRVTQVDVTTDTTALTCIDFIQGTPVLGCPLVLDHQTPGAQESAADFLPFDSFLTLPSPPLHGAIQNSRLEPTRILATGGATNHGDASYVEGAAAAPHLAIQSTESGTARSELDVSFHLDVATTYTLTGSALRSYVATVLGSPAQSDFSVELSEVGGASLLSITLSDDPGCVPLVEPLLECSVELTLAEAGVLAAGDYRLEIRSGTSADPFIFASPSLPQPALVFGDSQSSFDVLFEIAGPVPTPTATPMPTVMPTTTPTPTPPPSKKLKKAKSKLKKSKKTKKQKK